MKGEITITDKRGGIILIANIWAVIMMQVFSGKWGIMKAGIRVFIDETEIDEPEYFSDDT